MTRLFLIGLAFVMMLPITQAQNFEGADIQQLRKDFYRTELQLTPEEEKGLWPIFEEYKKEEDAMGRRYNTNAKFELMSDAEAEAYILESFKFEEDKIALKRTYFQKLMKVLPVRKVAMINRTERKFKRKILERVKKKRKMKQQRRF